MDTKVGCYVCSGCEIGNCLEVDKLTELATSEGAALAKTHEALCSKEGLELIKNDIDSEGLNRVIVAACSPRTLEPLFRDTLREAGLNQYYFEMANIREHCSWVHAREK